MPSSPLTPLSSPAHHRTRFSSPDELQLISPVLHSGTTSVSNPCYTDTPDAIIPEDTELPLRYSLRRRDPRQLNPYAYDKLLYKQQMRSNPDAIVKFRSPRRRSPGQTEDNQEDTQLDYVPLENPDEDEDYVESIPKPPRVTSNTNPDQVEEAPDESDTGWLPEALRPLSSSDEDDGEIRKLVKRLRREREKAEAKARAAAKKAEAEARKAHLGARRLTTKRKVFPIPSPVRSTVSSQRGVSLVRYSLLRSLVSGLTLFRDHVRLNHLLGHNQNRPHHLPVPNSYTHHRLAPLLILLSLNQIHDSRPS